MASMDIMIKSGLKYVNGIGIEYTRDKRATVPFFFYDEDILWFDLNGKRYGLPFDVVKKERERMLRSLRSYLE